ncbi:MAG: oxygen-independent coproporphyrinogen III oxidase [Bacteroidales bacterium]|nr:oxygen-independent coproporphyrinogen III oxidase [Bacteroidales bacterium]
MIERNILEKYNTAVPRYTSYPPANFFHENINGEDYRRILIESNQKKPENISLYIHIPFCPKLCFYCGCNTTITRNNQLITDYTEALKKEIRMVSELLDKNRKVSQIHWGGGTPNSLPIEIIKSIMELIYKEFQFIDEPEIAMECSPAYLTWDYLDELINLKFNRFSFGIQDFRQDVLKAVNRSEPAIHVEDLMTYIRNNSNAGINLDFIYGLPLQTVESFKETITQAAKLEPDRLVTFSYAHVPWFKKTQRKLEEYGLPDAEAKLQMFEAGYEIMTKAGYVPIGLDHYAKPDDELSRALENKMLHRNFQGYCTRETTGQVYAFGTSSISQLYSAYIQNTKDVKKYIAAMTNDEFAVEKGYELKPEQIVIREVINEIMCNQYLSWETIAERLNAKITALKAIIAQNQEQLQEFEADGLITLNDDGLTVKGNGRFVIRNIAASFDPIIKANEQKFSKSI